MQKLLTFFQLKILPYAIFNDQFNDMLTNDIVSFEQLGPELQNRHFFQPKSTIFISPRKHLSQRTTKPTYNKACVTSKDSDKPVYPPSMARILFYCSLNSQEAAEDSDQTVWMCRLI